VSTTLERPPQRTEAQAAPTRWWQVLRMTGPGLIVTASIVGSGEVIVTPKLGASVGFTLLWFIILGCLLKVFVQIELGRFALLRGMTTLEAMNTVPGPRFRVSWLLWLWLVMYLALVFQVAGIVGGVAEIFRNLGSTWSPNAWAGIVGGSCVVLLAIGRYAWVESISTLMVLLFTLCTCIAVALMQWTPYQITAAEVGQGMSFRLPANFTTAFAAFGIIGVGASELIYYPYWCLEKGYAKYLGVRDESRAWVERARGWLRVMQVDAWVSFAVYTGVTIAFYLLGAAVLHRKGLNVTDKEMISTLSHMYKETFGAFGLWIFLIGAFFALYSTVFVATASNARLLVDALGLFGVTRYTTEQRQRAVKIWCILLPIISVLIFCLWGAPVSLVFVGALAQALMLPFLAGAAVYFRYQEKRIELSPGWIWTALLCVAALAMAAVGIYQMVTEIVKRL
jgi:Mn2+/Fe2+ NRAMP family transporter